MVLVILAVGCVFVVNIVCPDLEFGWMVVELDWMIRGYSSGEKKYLGVWEAYLENLQARSWKME
jgi:hypothetical protein